MSAGGMGKRQLARALAIRREAHPRSPRRSRDFGNEVLGFEGVGWVLYDRSSSSPPISGGAWPTRLETATCLPAQVLVAEGHSLSFALPPTTRRSQFQLAALSMELCKCTKDLFGGRRTGRARPRYSGYIDVAADHRRCSGNDAMIVVAHQYCERERPALG